MSGLRACRSGGTSSGAGRGEARRGRWRNAHQYRRQDAARGKRVLVCPAEHTMLTSSEVHEIRSGDVEELLEVIECETAREQPEKGHRGQLAACISGARGADLSLSLSLLSSPL